MLAGMTNDLNEKFVIKLSQSFDLIKFNIWILTCTTSFPQKDCFQVFLPKILLI